MITSQKSIRALKEKLSSKKLDDEGYQNLKSKIEKLQSESENIHNTYIKDLKGIINDDQMLLYDQMKEEYPKFKQSEIKFNEY